MLEVRAEWDDEAGVWMATSEDVPGLCVQADTLDDLIATATALAPELLADNRCAPAAAIQLRFLAERTATIRVAA